MFSLMLYFRLVVWVLKNQKSLKIVKFQNLLKNGFFNFSQYEWELFHHYWDRLNAYLDQCAHYDYSYGKWKILGVVNAGMDYETRTLLEYWSFHSKGMNEAWDILGWLVGDTYKFEEVGFAFGISFLNPCAFHARSY